MGQITQKRITRLLIILAIFPFGWLICQVHRNFDYSRFREQQMEERVHRHFKNHITDFEKLVSILIQFPLLESLEIKPNDGLAFTLRDSVSGRAPSVIQLGAAIQFVTGI